VSWRQKSHSMLPDGELTHETMTDERDRTVHRLTLGEVYEVSQYPQEAKLRLADKLERIAQELRRV
jgi:hypothetical protein